MALKFSHEPLMQIVMKVYGEGCVDASGGEVYIEDR